jgi:hypothetical protein
MTDTIRPIYDETGSIRCLDIDGTRYTPDELRGLLQSAAAVDILFTRAVRLHTALMQIVLAESDAEALRAIARKAIGLLDDDGTPRFCPRCGNQLSNVSPGISIVAGGVQVCTPCALPGEEIARARGLAR